jgi:hypothetical protein
MKTDENMNDCEGMLDAVLTDERWQTVSEDLKHQALGALRHARQRRQLRMQISQAIFALILLGSLAWWFHSPASKSKSVVSQTADAIPPVSSAASQGPFVSEEEMLAMFPPGSCVLAEVDGRKELVFFDVEAARKGFVRSSVP